MGQRTSNSCEQHQRSSCNSGDSSGGSQQHSSTVGIAQGTGINDQHGLVNVNALNGNNVLNDFLNHNNVLSIV
jgi:hypothetical protein